MFLSFLSFLSFFKYFSSSAGGDRQTIDTDLVLDCIKRCVLDLNESQRLATEIIVPFCYTKTPPPPTSPTSFTRLEESESPAYSGGNDLFVESSNHYRSQKRLDDDNDQLNSSFSVDDELDRDYYYHNCLVNLLLKLFAQKSIDDKYALLKYLLELMPYNCELIKLITNTSTKLNGAKQTLQMLYDHLSINLITNEQLWIL